ncbi:MAG: DUF481 domain-containing protein [bacterium]|nr:DUF481 domain-containing protein [bacterium]
MKIQNRLRTPIGVAMALVMVVLVSAGPALAQDEEEPKLGWFDTAEFSLLASGGNTEVQTIALRNTVIRRWDSSSLEIALGGVRSETTIISRVAVGSPADFRVIETRDTALTAENYLLRGRYDHRLSEKFFWFAGAGWDKNEFAGIDSRFSAFAGVGHVWFERENARFRTDYGVTLTDQDDVSGATSSFAGVRLSYDYWRQINAATSFDSDLILDENADDSSDYRADLTNSVSAALSERLALKASLQLLYDNRPALTEVPLIQGDFVDGTRVLAELDSLDSTLTVSLVANF